jgi:hypothetical protein
VKPIRILLVEVPPLLTGILKDVVEHEPDLEYVDAVSLADALERVLPQAHTALDVLIVGATEAENPGLAGSLLMASPGTRVLMVANDGTRAVLYELYPVKTEVGDVSPKGLVHAMRWGGHWVH